MKEHAFRLKRGDDILDKITEYCSSNKINAAVILSSVGCVYEYRMRIADGITINSGKINCEIISINGTVSNGAPHVHIALADQSKIVFGGHMCSGCLVNTTCEIVLGELEEYSFMREYDEATSYDEIIMSRK